MNAIFSNEMEKAILELLSEYTDKKFKNLEKTIDEIEDEISDLRCELEIDKGKSLNYIEEKDLQSLVAKTMLILMPSFNEKISDEIKKHLVAIAEFVIKNFKEKE